MNMHGITLSLTLQLHSLRFSSPLFYLQNPSKSSFPISRVASAPHFNPLFFTPYRRFDAKSKRRNGTLLKASRRESPYEVLGISPSATPDQIKRAYRKLALKYHPDVNKEANAQEKFMRIKHAYNTLMSSESWKKYDSRSQSSSYTYSNAERNQSRNTQEEEFYGLEDFFRDLQEEYRNWEASAASQGKPKSLWEELAEIGEEFVEFLEKELNITDSEVEAEEYGGSQKANPFTSSETGTTGSGGQSKDRQGSSIEENIDEIEAALAKLKKELGL